MYKCILLVLLLVSNIGLKAQEINQEIRLANGQQFLLGKINLDGLERATYQNWFEKNYKAYELNKAMVKQFKKILKNYEIKIFLGTWCGDSRREVPRFLKILDKVKFPSNQLTMVALDKREGKRKTSPDGYENGLNIIRVPTFIFFKDGKEVNRIVEYPIASLEKDILKIVHGEPYTPNYSSISK